VQHNKLDRLSLERLANEKRVQLFWAYSLQVGKELDSFHDIKTFESNAAANQTNAPEYTPLYDYAPDPTDKCQIKYHDRIVIDKHSSFFSVAISDKKCFKTS
jgi:hypothetical protein